MPNLKASIKDVRKTKKRTSLNVWYKKNMKKSIREYTDSVDAGEKEKAQGLLKEVYKKIDKAVKKNIINKNNAARKKSRLTKMINPK